METAGACDVIYLINFLTMRIFEVNLRTCNIPVILVCVLNHE